MAIIVYGASCVWWDSIDKIAHLPSRDGLPGLPCCPHCKGVLFQIEESDWNAGAKKYEEAGHEGYVAFIGWLRGKCFPDRPTAEAIYKRQTGAS